MNSIFIKKIQTLDSAEWFAAVRGIKRGFEKECLRVDKAGRIAETPHPRALGSSLTHPMITTDYSEALLEFITPPTTDINELFNTLTDLHHYTYQVLKGESLWAASMPCFLPKEEDIPIAVYGSSNFGQLKHVYRRGLGYRYGRIMQTIAGIHYNFSLSEVFWKQYQDLLQSETTPKLFISEQYLGLIRNCFRYSWLMPLLFGASPAVSFSFFKGKKPNLTVWGKDTFVGMQATSLRLSDLGYHNALQSKLKISYNSSSEFLKTLKRSVHTAVPEYSAIGVKKAGEYRQLSDSLLQVEDEHYSWIRPKRVSKGDERMLSAITRDGIEYVEVRALDINPFIPIGIDRETVFLLDAFLVVCLLKESPLLTEDEEAHILDNQRRVAQYGRQAGLEILDHQGQPRKLIDVALAFFEEIEMVASLLDKAYSWDVFTQAATGARKRILEMSTLPSARILQEMQEKKESFFEFAFRWSLNHQKHFQTMQFSPEKLDYYATIARNSLQQEVALREKDEISFDEYLRRFLEEQEI